jgi:hypothetical protein
MTMERRKSNRLSMRVPVRVQGRDANGETWEEMTATEDGSMGGVSFRLKHPTQIGQVLHLSMPYPKRLRSYDINDASYRTYALVRNVRPGGEAPRIGVMFMGRFPPRGAEALPAGVFLMAGDPQPEERRRHPRVSATLKLKLQTSFARPGAPQEEQTVAEDIGKFGAQVKTSLPVGKGDMVMVEEVGGDFTTRAEIRNVSIGGDGHPRLNLLFLDGPAPERLLTAKE